MGNVFYRYKLENDYNGYFTLRLKEYTVFKETTKGYRIGDELFDKHWISKENTRKKFARETEQQALQDYIARTEKRITILSKQKRDAEGGLNKAKYILSHLTN